MSNENPFDKRNTSSKPHTETAPGNLSPNRRADLNEALRSVHPNVEIVGGEEVPSDSQRRKPHQATVEMEQRESSPRTPFETQEDRENLERAIAAFEEEVRNLGKEK